MNVEYSDDSNIKTKLLRIRRQNSGVRTIKFNLHKPRNEVGGRESIHEIKEGNKGECFLILEDCEYENESQINSRVSQDGDCKSFTCNMKWAYMLDFRSLTQRKEIVSPKSIKREPLDS